MDLIRNDFFSLTEPGIFRPIIDYLLNQGDYYMNLADLRSFIDAQERMQAVYSDPDAWTRKAIFNIARTGKFSSDRTIREYATDIWKVPPVEVTP